MKAKFLLLGFCCFSLLSISVSYAKRGYSYSYKTPRYSSSYGRTHTVKPYIKRDGTFVKRHRAGNPKAGVHCHNNVCY
ncbi:hypothetical protein SCZ71_00025 [Legionella pneumophila serogroup 1]|uniref:hypothetical protein n=1 Tax=Legionella pneumophila TaxID=446 RepID=UPI000152797F|nr:hypothetical protein [Legionella pneumophila]HAT8849740.1 hypothetical protein [Legionella pneumophila subsp. pneumophila]ABQ56110.1 hypothetical protein LPC_2184 [Legionella pneumophila str. Corby]MCK1859779.1 hypothetical protein [Legionella pneumophila]MCW8402018.1 hypothetical protein [Legionella pneumophila]MCW8457016.1 hypothetical protein [Legionella pneumophila]